ncbi:predicted protein [Sclerotinia sclerotiorum 1980 UF-70]|uniref:Uncharacterized protein n=1 Tax=Sclerotinia sclerotiorum (strain ATCC 18683 / 1980 / Ss-1) TaxID=665079 RepID=A7F0A5_SCLS1|nr:predicted protein [Sclerotinia sclerotiorum 1980 UF-70]EDN95147.1 predicted protein [Sclerotinia sclerotiorum 1980 UF-70]
MSKTRHLGFLITPKSHKAHIFSPLLVCVETSAEILQSGDRRCHYALSMFNHIH